MIDDKKSDKRDQIIKNDSDESNWMDMSDEKKYYERDQISKNDEEKLLKI